MIHQTVKESSFLSIGPIFANLADQDKSENHSKDLQRNKNTDLHSSIIGSLKHNGLLRSTKEKGYYLSPAGDPAVSGLDAFRFHGLLFIPIFLVTIFEKYTRSCTVKRLPCHLTNSGCVAFEKNPE